MLTVYKASAGSGKTFTLAYEYIRTLLSVRDDASGKYCLNIDRYAPGGHRRRCRHAHILAITFTNAATEEMKSRIIRQLSCLADDATMDSTIYTAMLCREFGCTRQELSQAAAKALNELLFDYNSFNVSTIDSFFQVVLRTFSREIDHQGDYELSLERKDMIHQSVSLMLDELNDGTIGKESRLYSWVKRYMVDKMAQGNTYNFFNRNGKIILGLVDLLERSMDETFADNSAALDEYLSDTARVDAFRRALKDGTDSAFGPGRDAAQRVLDFCYAQGIPREGINSSFLGRLEQMASGNVAVAKRDFVKIAAFAEVYEDKAVLKAAVSKKLPGGVLEAYRALCDDFTATASACFDRRDIYRTLLDSFGDLEFIGYVRNTLRKLLTENNMVLIADTGELLSKIISDQEMPFIYERLGVQLSNLLIDEFQDTSRVQWRNLKPLVANSLAEDNFCLIIGDVKQAIYRFRNSDSELLGSHVQQVDFPSRTVERGAEPRDNTNYRSAGAIVHFNNEVFHRLAADLGAGHYDQVRQAISGSLEKVPAYIKVNFVDDAKATQVQVLEDMVADIRRQHAAGYAWSDILILLRERDLATLTVRYITENHPDIPLLSSEALLLASSPAVRTIISTLRLIMQSYEGRQLTRGNDAPKYADKRDIMMMITRYHYFQSQGDDHLTALYKALDEGGEASEHLGEEVRAIRSRNASNLVSLIEAIVEERLTPQLRTEQYAYIAALQDLAIKHVEGPDPSLSAFLEAWGRNEGKWAIIAPSSLDAVQVMTVHKSKGLERACVHLPFANWIMLHQSTNMWLNMKKFTDFDPAVVPPIMRVRVQASSPLAAPGSPVCDEINADRRAEQMDNLNIGYVAFTRAGRELAVHCCKADKDTFGKYFYDAFMALMAGGELSFTKVEPAECDSPDAAPMPVGETYVCGAPTAPLHKADDGDRPEVFGAGEYNVNYRPDTANLVAIDDILAVEDDLGDEEDKFIVDRPPFDTEKMQDASRKGMNMHEILKNMRTLADFDAGVDRTCARMGVDVREKEEYRTVLAAAIRAGGDTVASWFAEGNKVWAERSFYSPADGRTYRMDRFLVRPDGVPVIIDYKFTTRQETDHRRQVSNYRRLVMEAGFGTPEVYLWYPLHPSGAIIKL